MRGRRRQVPVTITPYEDGPYLVRGPCSLLDQDGEELEVRRATMALCRCGRSRIKPLCDGTHKLIGFRAPGRGRDLGRDEPADEREGLRPAG